jgi:hypothetical protein
LGKTFFETGEAPGPLSKKLYTNAPVGRFEEGLVTMSKVEVKLIGFLCLTFFFLKESKSPSPLSSPPRERNQKAALDFTITFISLFNLA